MGASRVATAAHGTAGGLVVCLVDLTSIVLQDCLIGTA